MVLAGMDVARLNFSHGDADAHRQAAANVREAAEVAGRPVALLGDLQGPKIRTGRVEGTFQRLVRGRVVTLVGGGASAPTRAFGATSPQGAEVKLEPNQIHVSHEELVQALRPGDRVLLDDGRIELAVRAVSDGQAEASVVRGGLLGERKGVSVPGRTLPLPALTEKDLSDLKLAVELEVDYLALSFVRRPEDVIACQEHLGGKIPVIAKLEKLEAIRQLSKILEVADAVMVARGDLGVELKLGDLPAVQKDVIDRANRAGVPVITATEMLESMVTSNRPTRAEASDVANAIWDGTDAVMLSQETSIGAHPVEAVRAMARICLAAQKHPDYERARQIWREPGEVGSAIAHAAAATAAEIHAKLIIAFRGAPPDGAVLGCRPAARQPRPGYRPDDLERDRGSPRQRHGPARRPGSGRGGGPCRPPRPDKPAQSGERLRSLKGVFGRPGQPKMCGWRPPPKVCSAASRGPMTRPHIGSGRTRRRSKPSSSPRAS